ncbi:basic proline-rich protein-like [Enhydra lutris kenyoni]|uniref:Basic proline-rich protein-like n=1 Tax=Enhydra lutris kenyoni TaxID=391180 RepID=A0A2Y9JC67_ENHLU|nr:basic proline-rich protein-like [Enhydra lutris kenyoni]
MAVCVTVWKKEMSVLGNDVINFDSNQSEGLKCHVPPTASPSSLQAKLQETGGGGAVTSRRRCVTERRRLRRWRWLRQRRHFSRQRRRQRGCCSSQHPWRGHFSPILAEGRELQPPLQQFEFQFLQALRTGRTEEEPKKLPPLPQTAGAPPLAGQSVGRRHHHRRRPSLFSGAARGGRDRRRPRGGSPCKGRTEPASPHPERVSARDSRHVPGAELRLKPGRGPPARAEAPPPARGPSASPSPPLLAESGIPGSRFATPSSSSLSVREPRADAGTGLRSPSGAAPPLTPPPPPPLRPPTPTPSQGLLTAPSAELD